jgi:serine phosphatase RsbU (regulator of sigma subunit)
MEESAVENSRPVTATVMIVDDEELVTQSLGSFLELETDYRVVCFQSAREALKQLHLGPIDLVISDFLMPEMDGLKFLAEVKRLYPDVPRLLLTGYADKENAIKAINKIGLFQYLEKPWDNDQIRLVIRNALAGKSLEERLRERIRELDKVLRQRDELAERDSMLRRELQLARRLQENMLPRSLPGAASLSIGVKYVPALEIGGDFYDVIPLANDRLALLVSDATGHGIQAALSTALVKFAFSRFTGQDVTAAQVLAGMNSLLFEGLPSDVFIAAAVATVDGQHGKCLLANGGLPPPIVLRSAEARIERVPATGLLLGFAAAGVYQPSEEFEVSLEPGDTLLLYTDGLSETENESGEFFEKRMLSQTMLDNIGRPGRELVDILASKADDYRVAEQEPDDMTIIGIDRTVE